MLPRLTPVYVLGFCLIVYMQLQNSCVEGLASPASKKITTKGNNNNRGVSFGTNAGFASKTAKEVPFQEENDAKAKQTVRNLFSVVSHIQNPELYQPNWANAASRQTSIVHGKKTPPIVVATKDVPKGHPLTLFPIHALGLRTIHDDRKKKKKHRRDDTEFVAYDQDKDAAYFNTDQQQAGMRMKLNIPLDSSQPAASSIGDRKRHVLFSMFFPDKEIETGWLGGRIKSSGTTSFEGGNCVTIPIPGAAPICAIVATCDIKEGEELVQGSNVDVDVVEECKSILKADFQPELSELNGYIKMAC